MLELLDPSGGYVIIISSFTMDNLVGGFNHLEKYEFVSWDYCSQLNGKIKHVPNHQPAIWVYIHVFPFLGIAPNSSIRTWMKKSCRNLYTLNQSSHYAIVIIISYAMLCQCF
jgi:hypothetical protein